MQSPLAARVGRWLLHRAVLCQRTGQLLVHESEVGDLATGLESPGKLVSVVVRATLQQGTSLQASCCRMHGQLHYYSCDVVCLALLHLGLNLEPATWESLKDQARATLVHRARNRKKKASLRRCGGSQLRRVRLRANCLHGACGRACQLGGSTGSCAGASKVF